MADWARLLSECWGETQPWVQIPPSPPFYSAVRPRKGMLFKSHPPRLFIQPCVPERGCYSNLNLSAFRNGTGTMYRAFTDISRQLINRQLAVFYTLPNHKQGWKIILI